MLQIQISNRQLQVLITLALALVIPALTPPTASGQSPITARVDRTSIALDEQVSLTVTVTGDFLKIPRPDLSNLEDFVVASSSTSTQVSIVNGQMTSQGVFIYRLQPLVEGNLEIPPVSVNIDGQVYQTDPVTIEVLAAGTQLPAPNPNELDNETPNTLQGQDFFVEAEVDNTSPYLGEQVIYTFRIYQAVPFPPGQPDYTPPSFTDFWSHEITSQPHYNVDSNGRRYAVTEILTALFPANLGTLTIGPSSLVIPGGLLSPDIRLETEVITLEVRPLPEEGKPKNFGGAVGDFTISASLSESEVVVNNPLTLLVEIKGVGNIQTLVEPELPEMANWRIFESKSSTRTDTGNKVLEGTRTFERLVVPGQAGAQTFEPISFSFYNPENESYQVIKTTAIPVTVLPDDSQPALPAVVDVSPDGPLDSSQIVSDIRHIKPVPAFLRTPATLSVLAGVLYWAGWFIPLLVVAGVQLWHKRQQRLREDVAFARNQQAKRAAFKILDEARQTGNESAAAAGKALLGYLSDKLNTPTAGLTTDNLIDLLRRSGLATGLIERTHAILHQVDIGRFAPVSEGDAAELTAETRSLINDLEKSFKRRRR